MLMDIRMRIINTYQHNLPYLAGASVYIEAIIGYSGYVLIIMVHTYLQMCT